HSSGLQKGQIGIVHAFASKGMHKSNLVVATHELLHTLGATDKYDPATNLPQFPDGFADPSRQPRFPQRHAELMGGRIPISDTEATIPKSLRTVMIGPKTAAEINWRRPPE
ncbi:MAG: hypothetical protein AAF493_07305, partial [Pseudomonadota bacterium]